MKKTFKIEGGDTQVEVDTSLEACQTFSAKPEEKFDHDGIHDGRMIIFVGTGKLPCSASNIYAFFREPNQYEEVFAIPHVWRSPKEKEDLTKLRFKRV